MVLGEIAGLPLARSRGLEVVFLIRNGVEIDEISTLAACDKEAETGPVQGLIERMDHV